MIQIKIKALLWKHKKASNGEHEIRLRLTLYREVVYLNIGYTSSEKNWDENNDCPLSSHPKFKAIIKKIGELTDQVEFEVRLLFKNGIDTFSLRDLKNRVKTPFKKNSKIKILDFYDSVIRQMEDEGRIGYSKTFINSKFSIKRFLNGSDKSFISFTKNDFEKYEDFLLSKPRSQSTISYYIRTFITFWNLAIRNGHCPKEHHPAKFFRFKAYRRIKTRKRAVSPATMKAIEELQFDFLSRLYRSQQYFLFSYYARGINFIDLAKLKIKDNISGNQLIYTRSKNKRRYQYTLHSKAYNIVKIFLDYPLKSNGGYLFPILQCYHDTPKKIDARIDSGLKDLNEDLVEIEKLTKAERHLTSYVARHSFATNLRHRNVSLNIIQEALGHETETQTMTYLDELDDSIIANSIENALL